MKGMNVTESIWESRHKVSVYSLNSYVPYKVTEQFFRETSIEVERIDVDLRDKNDREKSLKDIWSREGNRSINQILFPKIIIDGQITITSSDKAKTKEMLIEIEKKKK